MKEIILKFNMETGEVKVEAMGFKGSSCQDATKFLADTLGESKDFQKKKEWYEKNMELNGNFNSNHCG